MSINSRIMLKLGESFSNCYRCGKEFEKYQKIFSKGGGVNIIKRYCIPCAKEIHLLIEPEIKLLENKLRNNILNKKYTQKTIQLIKEVNNVQDL